MGGDVAHGAAITVSGDPLREPSPLPGEGRLPGWRAAVAADYRAMDRVAGVLMRSLARSLGLREDYFDDSFRYGLSTLRLIRYPPRDAAELATSRRAAGVSSWRLRRTQVCPFRRKARRYQLGTQASRARSRLPRRGFGSWSSCTRACAPTTRPTLSASRVPLMPDAWRKAGSG